MTMLDLGTDLDLTVLEDLDFDTPCTMGRMPQSIAAGVPPCPTPATMAWKCRACGVETPFCETHARELEAELARLAHDPRVALLRAVYRRPKGWTGMVCSRCEHDINLPLLFVPIK